MLPNVGSEAVPLGADCTWRGLPDEEAWLACQKELAISTAKDSGDHFQQPKLEAMAASYPSSSPAGVWPAVAASCVGSNSLLWSVRLVGCFKRVYAIGDQGSVSNALIRN